MDPEVVEMMIPLLRDQFGNPSSVHHFGRGQRAIIEKARKTIAELLGASPGEIFFTSGGTEADNMAIRGAVEGLGVKHIATTAIEHHAVTHPVEELEKEGKVKVTWLPVDSTGRASLSALEQCLSENPNSLVCLMHANNELGTLNDIAAIAALCEKYKAYFHSDTVQSMGNIPYKLNAMHLHFLTAAGHKFYGPKGVGFFYLKSGTKLPSLISGGSQERNLRAGTENVAGIAALAFALEKCYKSLDKKTAHLRALKHRMIEGLRAAIPGVDFNGDISDEGSIPTVLNVAFPGNDDESMILFNLDIEGVCASGGSACTSGSVKGSHVLMGIGCSPARAANSVRFSFGVQNTVEEVDFVVAKLAEMFRVKA